MNATIPLILIILFPTVLVLNIIYLIKYIKLERELIKIDKDFIGKITVKYILKGDFENLDQDSKAKGILIRKLLFIGFTLNLILFVFSYLTISS